MNLIDPQDLANALRPILQDAEETISTTVTNAVTSGVAQINEAIQKGLDRLHGIKINTTVDVPPRADSV